MDRHSLETFIKAIAISKESITVSPDLAVFIKSMFNFFDVDKTKFNIDEVNTSNCIGQLIDGRFNISCTIFVDPNADFGSKTITFEDGKTFALVGTDYDKIDLML